MSTGDFSGLNLFVYCGNNPVNRFDPTGHAWYHWAICAAVVAGFAIATVVTCGGFAAAATAVGLVSSGVALSSATATAVTAAFIGSATVYGTAVLAAAGSSNSLQDFADHGNWGTVFWTALGAGFGMLGGYNMYRSQSSNTNSSDVSSSLHQTGRGSPKKNLVPNGSYTQLDDSGNIYSYTQFDSQGRQTMRIDFQGRPHNGVLPHIHLFTYPERGGQAEYVFDLFWNLIG